MSYALEKRAWAAELPMIDKFVLIYLARVVRNHDGTDLYASMNGISKAIGACPRAVQNAMYRLSDAGYLEITAKANQPGGKRTNEYRLIVDRLPAVAEPAHQMRGSDNVILLEATHQMRGTHAPDAQNLDSIQEEDSLAGAKEGDARAGAPPAPVPTASVAEPPKEAKGSRWPSGQTVPQDWIAEGYAVRTKAGLPEIDLDLEAANFADHWAAASGSNATKRDWRAAWRVWARKSYQKPLGTGVTINGNASHAHSSAGRTDFFAANFIRTAGILRN